MQRTKQVNHSDGMKIMTESDVEFHGSIEVRVKHDPDGTPFVEMYMEGQAIELELEEAAVLTYQLQLALKEIQSAQNVPLVST